MGNVNINIAMLFKQRIVPGVYQFDIVITNPPYCGAVVGTIIHGKDRNMITGSTEVGNYREEITQKTYEVYESLKEMFGD